MSGGEDPMGPELAELRAEIERVDGELIALLAERVRLARRAGEVKRDAGLPILDPAREAAQIRRTARLSREAGVPAESTRDVFWNIIGLCRRAQLGEPL